MKIYINEIWHKLLSRQMNETEYDHYKKTKLKVLFVEIQEKALEKYPNPPSMQILIN